VFTSRGPIALYLAWLDRGLAAANAAGGVPPGTRARALQLRGRAQPQRGRVADGLLDLAAALEAARAAGDRGTEGTVLADLGYLHYHARDMDQARAHYEKALAIHRGLGDRRSIGRVLGNLGTLHYDLKSFEEAHGYYNRALSIYREIGDRRGEAVWLQNLGLLHQERGEPAEAQRHFGGRSASSCSGW
jgi:tetratricopeptide (TPR) repeat protein